MSELRLSTPFPTRTSTNTFKLAVNISISGACHPWKLTTELLNLCLHRALEDYAVVYFGSPLFKILRLLVIAIFSIHLFACVFYRVKEISAESHEDVEAFYAAKNVDGDVSLIQWHKPHFPAFYSICFQYYTALLFSVSYSSKVKLKLTTYVCVSTWLWQSISYKYVSLHLLHL